MNSTGTWNGIFHDVSLIHLRTQSRVETGLFRSVSDHRIYASTINNLLSCIFTVLLIHPSFSKHQNHHILSHQPVIAADPVIPSTQSGLWRVFGTPPYHGSRDRFLSYAYTILLFFSENRGQTTTYLILTVTTKTTTTTK